MSTRGAVLFLGLSCFLFFMSIGAGCPFALSAGALTAKHMPMMHTLPTLGPRTHSQAPAFAMHPLNAPVRPGNNAVGRHVVGREKQVLIHGAQLRHVMVSPE
jgi:hypothetical protein